jgi:hypothetical protein
MTSKVICPPPSPESVREKVARSTYGVVVADGAGRSRRFAPPSTPATIRLNGLATA